MSVDRYVIFVLLVIYEKLEWSSKRTYYFYFNLAEIEFEKSV